MGRLQKWLNTWKQKRMARRIERGLVPRGRTDLKAVLVSAGATSAVFGGAVLTAKTRLIARHLVRAPGARWDQTKGEWSAYVEVLEDRREVWNRVVTTVGVNFIVDAFQNIVELEAMNFHDSGTGIGGEAVGDTALGIPTGEARDSGTQGENGANTYQTVATHTYAGAFAITEHGLFDLAAAGVLLDRTVFGAINVVASDQIQFTFEITFAAGG